MEKYTRKINAQTGDYEILSNQIIAEDPIKQAIYLALKTSKGTSADVDLGQEYTKMKIIPDNFDVLVRKYVYQALSRLIKENKIKVNNIEVYKENSKLGIWIKYIDLTKNVEGIIKI